MSTPHTQPIDYEQYIGDLYAFRARRRRMAWVRRWGWLVRLRDGLLRR